MGKTTFNSVKWPSVLVNGLAILGFVLISGISSAQSFSIGHTTRTFFDASRNRNVETEIYYPAASTGNDVAIASGTFPVLVFGHGFVMAWSAYQNFWEQLVPEGYIMCFPTTEGGLIPSHGNFGNDLKFVASQMQLENSDSASLFFNVVAPQTALMGHSMGGGASFLGAANNSEITALVNFAAAETNPSAISAAANVSVPTLVFSGAEDCITPEASNQNPMYTNLASACKTQISINDGVHCYYANYNLNCSAGEFFCNASPDISRASQQATTFSFLKPWLNSVLRGNTNSSEEFTALLESSNLITYNQSCATLSTATISKETSISIFPNPVSSSMMVKISSDNLGGTFTIFNYMGQQVYKLKISATEARIDLSMLGDGMYLFNYTNDTFNSNGKFIKVGK